MDKEENINFEKITLSETLKKLSACPTQGLSNKEAVNRLSTYGPNALTNKKKSFLKKFLSYFWGPIPLMIEIAAILSAFLQNWPDFIIILSLLLINSLLGFFQEYKADKAIMMLKKNLALTARVLRNGIWKNIEASKLVPGDIIAVELGNIVPADIKLISGNYLSIDQSALTGESLAVSKTINDVAYSSTIVKLGEMQGVVTATGAKTFIGKTTTLVSEAHTKSHHQEAILKIGNFLIFTTLFICAASFISDLYKIEISHTISESFSKLIIFMLVLIVGGIPVALPSVLSVTMAIGARQLAKLKAIVSKLTATEALSGIDLLCLDKTGTLTKNEMTIGDVVIFNAKNEKDIMLSAALATSSDEKDAIDKAILDKLGNLEQLKQFQITKYIPFDPIVKKTIAEVKMPNKSTISVSKGAPQAILQLVHANKKLEKEVMNKITNFAKDGYRTLGVAKTNSNGKWIFLGIISLFDPPREDTLQTLKYIKAMGIKVKMLTGDHVAIARELGAKLGFGKNIISLPEALKKDPSSLEKLLEKADGFAEIFPEHKFDIIKALQKKQHIVGMTGDGVNDAPALKQSNVGIAVSGATDAAREAADIVLTKPGLAVIFRAIKSARKIFGRMRAYTTYRVSETIRLLLFLFLAMMVFNQHPLTPIMIVLIALLNDVPIMMIAYDKMPSAQRPTAWNMKEIFTIAIGLGTIGVCSTFGLYWIAETVWQLTPSQCKTLAFMKILCAGNLTIYLTRNEGMFWDKPLPEKKFLISTTIPLIIGTIISVYGLGIPDFIGIGWYYVWASWVYIIVWFIISFLGKLLLYKILNIEREKYTLSTEPQARIGSF